MTRNIGITGRFRLIDTGEALNQTIKGALYFRAKKAFREMSPQIISRVRALVEEKILSSDTTYSILHDSLRDEFGLTESRADNSVAAIINYMTRNIEVKLSTANKTISILLLIPPANNELISAVPQANFSTEKGPVHWLTWLLLNGTQVVIHDYRTFYDNSVTGRSGGDTIMIKDRSGVFRVDPEHAGTESDNFITRAIDDIADDILMIMREEAKRSFENELS